ncbi:CAP-Gly domain-containing linker protein 3 [Cucumispora dikerogammari]|nr:CAP-Gly domain-containing linker protein 3 [Cucumispora dikerogammari]
MNTPPAYQKSTASGTIENSKTPKNSTKTNPTETKENDTHKNTHTLSQQHISAPLLDAEMNTTPCMTYKLNDEITINKDIKGIIKYIGRLHTYDSHNNKYINNKTIWIGIELKSPKGKHNGIVNGVRYFECKDRHGLFVKLEKLKTPKNKSDNNNTESNNVELNISAFLESQNNEHIGVYKGGEVGEHGSVNPADDHQPDIHKSDNIEPDDINVDNQIDNTSSDTTTNYITSSYRNQRYKKKFEQEVLQKEAQKGFYLKIIRDLKVKISELTANSNKSQLEKEFEVKLALQTETLQKQLQIQSEEENRKREIQNKLMLTRINRVLTDVHSIYKGMNDVNSHNTQRLVICDAETLRVRSLLENIIEKMYKGEDYQNELKEYKMLLLKAGVHLATL